MNAKKKILNRTGQTLSSFVKKMISREIRPESKDIRTK
jgi:hypothetical protein